MKVESMGLFSNVAERDYLDLIDSGAPRCRKVAEFLHFDDGDVARATGVPRTSIRLASAKVPPEVTERILEWAQALNLVAQFFRGDVDKTALWFAVPNPLLGGVTPRDMIRLGRFSRLREFILDALAENVSSPEAPSANA